MTEDDLLVDLPGTVWINNYPFVLLETDKVSCTRNNDGDGDGVVAMPPLLSCS